MMNMKRLRCGRPLSMDLDTRDSLVARRNILLGLWAGRVLGLPEAEREAYAWSVHFADFDAPGHDDVVAKLAQDFAARGIRMPERRIRRQLKEMDLRAYLHLANEAPRRHRRLRRSRNGESAGATHVNLIGQAVRRSRASLREQIA